MPCNAARNGDRTQEGIEPSIAALGRGKQSRFATCRAFATKAPLVLRCHAHLNHTRANTIASAGSFLFTAEIQNLSH